MHYYQFNLSDYITATAHLSPIEDIAYRRLLDLYYEKESPIPNETDWVSRRIRMVGECKTIESILHEYFTLNDKNEWAHDVCERNIKAYQTRCKTNKANSLKGGRPKKTDSVSNRNQIVTLTNNHKPITNNHIKTLDQSEIDQCFELFWNSGIRKVNKKKTKPLFARYLASNHDPTGPTIYDLTNQLINDVKARLKSNQLGFAEMHPTTYFNGERWSDEIKERTHETNQSNSGNRQESNLARVSRWVQADIAKERTS